jgi:hypothetical protein
LYLFQGLAVVHNLLRGRGLGPGWLFAPYLLLVVFMPYAALVIACLGLIDIWADLRVRLAPGSTV